MVINRLTLTYSLLAQIKETSSNESTSLIDLFIPMVKQSISDFCEENGVLLCENIADIKSQLKKTFLIDIPIPVLRTILGQIEMEINDKNLFQVFSDGSCIIKRTHYDDLMPIISKGEKALSLLQEDFKNYCSICKIDYNFDKLENFIRSQQIELFTKHNINYTNIEPEIPNYLELKLKSSDQEIFNTISNIFIGGIITDYITLKYDSTVVKNTELLVDTNFIISLLDLNTVDATCTCKDLLRLCQSMGFSFKIFNKTINQINFLLNDRIENFKDRNFGWVKQNDIFAACVRRKLTKTELKFIKDNLLRSLEKFKISIIYDAQIDKLLLQAKMSKSYKILSQIRQNSESALLDSLAEVYVNQRRGNNISCFADIKCWFLHNSTNPTKQKVDIKQRWSISADELLTMLWLTNPAQCNDLTSKEVAKSCLTAYISKFRDSK